MTTKTTHETSTETQAPADGEPKKLLLGKRVVRHFNVKSAIQTGAGTITGSSTRLRCYDTVTDGSIG